VACPHLNVTRYDVVKQGVRPKIVREKLGHNSITVTLDLYSYVSPGMQRQAAEKLDDWGKIIAKPLLGNGKS